MKNEIKVPFLLCIPVEQRGDIIEALGKYQKKYYGTNLNINLRTQSPEIPLPEIPTEELSSAEIEHMMSQAPSRRQRDAEE